VARFGCGPVWRRSYDRLSRDRGLRFCDTLTLVYYAQLCSERRIVRYTRGVPVRRWERKPGMAAETLDALVYAHAARHLVHVPVNVREAGLCDGPSVTPLPATTIPSPWVAAW
jgi:phage terminase large subunit GpA-like protein